MGHQREFWFKAPTGIKFGEIHPDRLALVAILNTLPFCEDELHLEWPVSTRFLNATKTISRIKISAEPGEIRPKDRGSSGLHSLSFSGGADSIAALAVMPHLTESVFMLRHDNGSRSLYDSDAALESCRQLGNLGFITHIVESNFEYLREPIGFPTDLSVSSPNILLSCSRGYDSIAFGTILESAYGTSGTKYRDYTESSHFILWSKLFESVGLGYSLPVAGVSEVGTAIICRNTALGRFHQSCIRGKWESPCNRCWKCFRKNALLSALDNTEVTDHVETNLRKSKEVRKKILSTEPIKHEGVLTYCLERSIGRGEVLDRLKELVRVGEINTSWMEKWYPTSKELIDDGYSEHTEKRILAILGSMTEPEMGDLRNWSNEPSDGRRERLRRLNKLV